MTTVLGTALVATGLACIVAGTIWYLVGRHRDGTADLAEWSSDKSHQGLVGDGDAVIRDASLGFSPCVALNAAAGADMVVVYARKLWGECLPRAPMPYRSGVRMVRHLDEVFET